MLIITVRNATDRIIVLYHICQWMKIIPHTSFSKSDIFLPFKVNVSDFQNKAAKSFCPCRDGLIVHQAQNSIDMNIHRQMSSKHSGLNIAIIAT